MNIEQIKDLMKTFFIEKSKLVEQTNTVEELKSKIKFLMEDEELFESEDLGRIRFKESVRNSWDSKKMVERLLELGDDVENYKKQSTFRALYVDSLEDIDRMKRFKE